MKKSVLSAAINFVKNRKLFLIMLSFAVLLSYSSYVEARTVPRSSSKTIRFPTSDEDRVSFEDGSSALFLTKRTRENNLFRGEQTQGKSNTVISLDSTPIKVLAPQSPSTSGQDTLSSENTEGLNIPNEDEHNNNVEHGNNSRDDEVLRMALCPPVNSSNSSTIAANLNRDESDIGTSSAAADSNKLRYDLNVGKCAQVGERAPHCGGNMIFVADIDSAAYGYCECDFDNKILRREEKQAALRTRTPLVFHPKTNACYRLYEQAYCNAGEWLVLSRKEKGPICEQKRCPAITVGKDEPEVSAVVASDPTTRRRTSKLLTPSFWTDSAIVVESAARKANNANGSALVDRKDVALWVPLNGSGPCVKLFEENNEHCDDGEQVVFSVGDIEPKCGFLGRAFEGRAIIRNACPPGSYYSIIGRCQPDWEF